MAILKNGILGKANGKISNLVTYTLNGQEVIRTIGMIKKAPTDKQLNNKLQMKVLVGFLNPIETLLRTGFNPMAEGTKYNFHNLAIANNKPNALKGFYPEVEIDYSKIVFSKGDLPQPENPAVELVKAGLRFSWNTETLTWPYNMDQVMLLAYCPATNEYAFVNSGARRLAGHAVLEIPLSARNQLLEVYISFVSDDRRRVADSLYLGQIGAPRNI